MTNPQWVFKAALSIYFTLTIKELCFYVKIVAHNDESMEIHPSIRLSFQLLFFFIFARCYGCTNCKRCSHQPGYLQPNVGTKTQKQNPEKCVAQPRPRHIFGFIKGGFKFMWNIRQQQVQKPKPVGVQDVSEPNHNTQSGYLFVCLF